MNTNFIKINNLPKVTSISKINKALPPRYQKYSGSPRRVKITPSKKLSSKHSSKYSPTLSPCEKSFDIKDQPYTPNFTPTRNKQIFLSEPNDFFYLQSKVMTQVKNDLSRIVKIQKSKEFEKIQNVANIKKGCKQLTKLIIQEARQGREQLNEISYHEEAFHEKSAEFFKEIKKNNLFAIKTLLVLYPELINEVDSTLQSALHWAAKRNNVKLLKYLISCGANPRTKDIAGRTPEQIARKYEYYEILSVLAGNERRSALDLSTKTDSFQYNKIENNLVGLTKRNFTRSIIK